MEEQTPETKDSATSVPSEMAAEGDKEDVIMEEVEKEDAATKEEEVILEEDKQEEQLLDKEKEEEVTMEEIKDESAKPEESEQAEANEKAEESDKFEENIKKVPVEAGADADGQQPAPDERGTPSTTGSRITFKRRVASDRILREASTTDGVPTESISHPSFRSRFSSSVGSGHHARVSKVYSANSGAAITNTRRSMAGKVPSTSSGHRIKSPSASSTSSKGRDPFSSQSNQQVKVDQESHPARRDSGNIMGGDWRKVISKRRGATCSVEVIWKLRQSEIAVERRREGREFCTGSSFVGHVDAANMEGESSFTMPHGVVYEGDMHDGQFDSLSTLTYPNKGKVDGCYTNGKMAPATYTFPDGLVYELADWKYCSAETPDRRFQQEIKYGLKPVCTSLKTQQQPTRTIPEGCYDTGDGFYNPKTRCVTSATTGNIIRIPTKSEATWIAKNCRKAWDEPSGFRPTLYDNFCHDDVNYAPLLLANRRRKNTMDRSNSSGVKS